MKKLADFSRIKILIVGDVMIDRYCWGAVERISPEAPVPVVRLDKTTLTAGGAANVAANVAGLGAKPYLVGIVGDDEEARLFPRLLLESNVSPEFLLKIKNRPTTVKTRVIAHSQQVARIDQETNAEVSKEAEKKVWAKIKPLLETVNVIIISDYAKGLLSASLLSDLIGAAKAQKIKILIDPKGKNYAKYKNADIITPNQREVAEACGMEEAGAASIEKYGGKLLSELNLKSLLVTRGENGMMLLEEGRETIFLNALARKVYDVTGAGDTVIATLAAALAAKMNLRDAARLANVAAGLVVEQLGTTAIKIESLRAEFEKRSK